MSFAGRSDGKVTVPIVTGSYLHEGFATLRAKKLCVELSDVLFAAHASNRIISQGPEGGARVRPGSIVRLVVDRDEGTPVPSRRGVEVPRVVGLSLGEAVERLEGANVREWQALATELPPSRAATVGDAFVVKRQWRVSYQQAMGEYGSPFLLGATVRLALRPRSSLSCS